MSLAFQRDRMASGGTQICADAAEPGGQSKPVRIVPALLNSNAMKSTATIVCLCFALLVTPSVAATRAKPPVENTTQKVQPGQAPAVAPADPAPSAVAQFSNIGVVAQAAAQSGVHQCVPRMNQVVNFLSATAQTGAMVFTAPSEPDRRQASIGLEVLGSNGLSYIDTTYSPSANGCDATYAQVTYWENSCTELVKSGFPGFTRINQMRQHIGVLDGGSSAKVFLMPAGTGCVSIKKEVLY